MSGFSAIIGFMFTFMVIGGIFIGLFYFYNDSVITQAKLYDITNKNLLEDLSLNLEISESLIYSDGIMFKLKNIGNIDFKFKTDSSNYCVDVYVDGIYYDDFYITPHFSLKNDYSIIESSSSGLLFVKGMNIQNKELKIITCTGKDFVFNFDKNDYNVLNDDWNFKKNITINNPSSFDISDYQILFEFNSTSFNFNDFDIDSLRFSYDISQNLVLDLTFDNYIQNIKDSSKFTNNVFLGSDSSNEISDPAFNENSVILNSLFFDGVDDFLTINYDSSLNFQNELSVFSWIKWNSSSSNFYNNIFRLNDNSKLGIVNDGGVNDNKLRFDLRIEGIDYILYSNSLIDSNWHLIGAVYDGNYMKIYIDGNLDSISVKINGKIDNQLISSYISYDGVNSFFSGLIDDFKLFNIALTDSEIKNLNYNLIERRMIDYYVSNYDLSSQNLDVYVKIPFINSLNEVDLLMLSNYVKSPKISSMSSIEKTFTYNYPKLVGFVLSDNMNSNSLGLLSLQDNSSVIINNNQVNLNFFQTDSLISTDFGLGDGVYMNNLVNVEGQGNGLETIIPISWAGTEFVYNGFRNNQDKFCMMSIWGNANVEIYDNSVLEWSGVINSNPTCIINDITNNNNLNIRSDIDILVHYYGNNGRQDSFNMVPVEEKSLIGVPSNALYLASSSSGANLDIYRSSTTTLNQILTPYSANSVTATGTDGSSPAFLIKSNSGSFGAVGQADSDGVEVAVLVPLKEMGTHFGSTEDMEYVVFASIYSDANCSLYDSTNTLNTNRLTGSGTSDVFKYSFGNVGSDGLYLTGPWRIECDKPVWGYYEKNTPDTDETSLFSYLQMKQHVYPEPESWY